MLLNLAYWLGVFCWVARFTQGATARILAALIVGFAGIILSLEFLSAFGAIRFPFLAAVCLILLASGLLATRRRWNSFEDLTGNRAVGFDSLSPRRVVTLTAVCLAALSAVDHLAAGLLTPVTADSDAPIYHLPFAIQWTKTCRITFVPTPFGEESASYFPANGELWLLWLMVTHGGELFAKVGQWPFLTAGAVSLYALARQNGGSREAAVLPAAIWAVLPLTLHESIRANVDLIWTALFFAAIYFSLEYRQQLGNGGPNRFSLVLASLAMGCVLGTKSVGLVFVPLVALPLAWAIIVRSKKRSDLVWLAAGICLPSAFWYLRNVWWTGNPVYPLDVSVFGHRLLAGWSGRAEMAGTAYHLPVSAWPQLIARLCLVMGPVFAGLWAASIGLGLWGMKTAPVGTFAKLGRCEFALLAVMHVLIYWFIIPYNTQERFLLPAMGLGLLPMSAWITTRPRTAPLFGLLIFGQFAASAASSGVFGPRNVFPFLSGFQYPVSLFWVLLVVILAAFVLAINRSLEVPILRLFAVIFAVSVLCVSYLPTRLPSKEPVPFYPRAGFAERMLPGWQIVEELSPPGGQRIAYCGTNLPYYLFGVGLRNSVDYVAINDKPDWRPHDFHRVRRQANLPDRSADPWPHWYRQEGDCRAWLQNLAARRIDLLFIARVNTHGRLVHDPSGMPAFPIERQWADSHPEQFEFLGPFPAENTVSWVRVYRVRQSPAQEEAVTE